MRAITISLFLLLSNCLAVISVHGQSVISVQGQGGNPVAGQSAGGFGRVVPTGGFLAAVVTNAPYSAVAVTETTQTLADGNRILRSTSFAIARDGRGRVRREIANQPGGVNAVMILDPVANATYLLDVEERTAETLPLVRGQGGAQPGPGVDAAGALVVGRPGAGSAPAGGTGGVMRPPGAGGAGSSMRPLGGAGGSSAAPPSGATIAQMRPTAFRRESLGTRTIEGLQTQGTRTVRTIPAGQIGNERPIEIVTEEWFSPELQVVLLRRNVDPRTSEIVYRLTQIRRGEPNAALFTVPAGYTAKQ